MKTRRTARGSFGVVLALLALLGGAALRPALQPQPAWAAQLEAYFVMEIPPRKDEFIIKLTDPAKIQHARNLISGAVNKPSQVRGKLVKTPVSYNPPWQFHLDPQTIEFFDSAIEVCDSSIAYVDTHLDEAGGAFLPGNAWCPWASRLLREITPPASQNGVTSVSAASYRRAGVAEEAIVAAYGANLALQTATATALPLPTVLVGTTVRIIDRLGVERFAPLFFVSPAQVNYLVPAGAMPGPVTVVITNSNGVTATEWTQALNIAPGLFTANADGKGVPAAVVLRIRKDGSRQFEPVAQFDPAQNKFVPSEIDLAPENENVFLLLFGTGWRRNPQATVEAKIGGQVVEVAFAGAQPNFAGLDQVTLVVPRALRGSGEANVVVHADDQKANPVVVRFK